MARRQRRLSGHELEKVQRVVGPPGDITLWFSEEVIAAWEHANREVKVGRPFTYSDGAIECLLTLRELFRLPYRQTEGLGRALVKLLEVDVADSRLHVAGQAGRPIEESRWNCLAARADRRGRRQHGPEGLRGGRVALGRVPHAQAAHLAEAASVDQRGHARDRRRSAHQQTLRRRRPGSALLAQIDPPVAKLYGDGAYDKWKLYDVLARQEIQPVIPPRRGASIRQHGNCAGRHCLATRRFAAFVGWVAKSWKRAERLPSPQPGRDEHVSAEAGLRAATQKQRLREPTNRSPTEMQTPQSFHPTWHADNSDRSSDSICSPVHHPPPADEDAL